MPDFQFSQLVVLPGASTGGGESLLDDGLVIPLVDLTTTTTSTITVTTVTVTTVTATSMTQTQTTTTTGTATTLQGRTSSSDGTTMRLAVPLVTAGLLWLAA